MQPFEANAVIFYNANISWVDAFCLCTNLDCNIGICHYCSRDACMASTLADMPRKLKDEFQMQSPTSRNKHQGHLADASMS